MKLLQFSISAIILSTLMISCGGSETKPTNTTNKQDDKTEPVTEEVLYVATSFGELLVELESNMSWESVTEDWKVRRESWVIDCDAAADVTAKADLLLEFEANVQWSAVQASWANVREAWGVDCIAATTDGELADLLIIFESYVLWEVVSPNWVDLREDWISRCTAVE